MAATWSSRRTTVICRAGTMQRSALIQMAPLNPAAGRAASTAAAASLPARKLQIKSWPVAWNGPAGCCV
jgi:hypothetical protein